MRSVHVALALGLAALGLHGCLTDFEHLCQTDDDCPGNQRCLIADDCNGVLWELPLDGDGKPTEGEPIRHDLAGCNKPFVIDSLPATDEQGPMTFVGCEGKSHILVLGRN